MPFNLDFKSVAVGVLIAWFVIPWLRALLARGRSEATA